MTENTAPDKDRVEDALNLIFRYSQIDGAHHKAWVFNELVKVLSDDYKEWVKEYEEDGEYEWDEGIAP